MAQSQTESLEREAPVRQESISSPQELNNRLMPSHKDFEAALPIVKSWADASCSLPDFEITQLNGEQILKATPKLQENYALAREALNSPTPGDGQPASAQERLTAQNIAGLVKKADEDMATSPASTARSEDTDQLKDIFKTLDPASIQRVINEVNRALAADGLKIAQSSAGEIWSGTVTTYRGNYALDTMLKGAGCAPMS